MQKSREAKSQRGAEQAVTSRTGATFASPFFFASGSQGGRTSFAIDALQEGDMFCKTKNQRPMECRHQGVENPGGLFNTSCLTGPGGLLNYLGGFSTELLGRLD